MNCPYLMEKHSDGPALCVGVLIPFEPGREDQNHYCRTARYRHCALYPHAGNPLSRAIRREVARAIG